MYHVLVNGNRLYRHKETDICNVFVAEPTSGDWDGDFPSCDNALLAVSTYCESIRNPNNDFPKKTITIVSR